MTEGEAHAWLATHVPRETLSRLENFVAAVLEEASRQNLISAATIPHIWARHVVDSAQLIALVPSSNARWLDLGSGAGFPGLIIAILGGGRVTLAESRPLRVAFLRRCVERLGLSEGVEVHAGKVERLTATPFDVISARAFAPLDRLFACAYHLAQPETLWILPKGRSVQAELDVARRSWQGDFTVVPSLTDAEAAIVQARNVRPRAGVRRDGSKR